MRSNIPENSPILILIYKIGLESNAIDFFIFQVGKPNRKIAWSTLNLNTCEIA